jgi:starch synthase (maltosyl-transferring)
MVITDLDVGGAEQALVSLALSLDQKRWVPAVIALGMEGPLAAKLRSGGIPCRCLECSRFRPFQLVARLGRTLQTFQPELVQSFLFHANLASRLAASWVGNAWVVGGIRVAERQKRWHLAVDRITASLATGSVCVSNGVLRFSRDIAGLDSRRLTVIPNGIDPKPFDKASPVLRSKLGIPEEAHLALFIGRLAVQKGLPDLLNAAEWVIPQCSDWHLVLVGQGPYQAWLLEESRRRPQLRGKIHCIGARDDVPRLLRAADVLVLSSLWEGMPNVVLEAMAASRPVVATCVEGTEELVIPTKTGWLVPPGDPVALGSALLHAALNPELCQRFGQEGRARVEREFSLDRIVEAYDRLWSGLLGYESGSTAK